MLRELAAGEATWVLHECWEKGTTEDKKTTTMEDKDEDADVEAPSSAPPQVLPLAAMAVATLLYTTGA